MNVVSASDHRCSTTACIVQLTGGQYARMGGMAFLAKDMADMVHSLPRSPEECDLLLIQIGHYADSNKFHVYTVRADKVKAAIEWLVEHNPLYYGLTCNQEKLDLWQSPQRVTEITSDKEIEALQSALHVSLQNDVSSVLVYPILFALNSKSLGLQWSMCTLFCLP